jgi:tetratricopeptide (TPR) repeat protein
MLSPPAKIVRAHRGGPFIPSRSRRFTATEMETNMTLDFHTVPAARGHIVIAAAALAACMAFGTTRAQARDNVVHMMTAPTAVRGTLEIENGQYDKAIQESLKVVGSSSPRTRAAAFANLCIGHAQRGEYAKALEFCDLGVAEDRYATIAYVNRGAVHYLLGNHTNSIADLEQALQRNSYLTEARNNLARAERGHAALGGRQNLAQTPSK